MRKYIESIEQGEDGDHFIKEEIPFITIAGIVGIGVPGRTFSQASTDATLNKVKAKEKYGKIYKRRIHVCRHEEGQSCTTEDI